MDIHNHIQETNARIAKRYLAEVNTDRLSRMYEIDYHLYQLNDDSYRYIAEGEEITEGKIVYTAYYGESNDY